MTSPSPIRTESLEVRRTALVASLGPEAAPGAGVRELWYVIHGYSMRAVPFLEDCRAIARPDRLIVAPEALSRYYDGALPPDSSDPARTKAMLAHRSASVVASWMTRDQRDDEIRDYINYLDDVHAIMTRRFGGAAPPVTVLGFSQGGATALRWIAMGNVRPARLVIWASSMPPELDYAADARVRAPELSYVCGTTDQFITPKVLDQQHAMLRAANLPFRALSFVGGHRLDDGTLRTLAG